MNIPIDEILNALEKLPAFAKMKVTVQNSVKYGSLVGLTTIISSIIAGPAGLAIGGITSSLAATYYARGKYQSVISILKRDLTLEQKEELMQDLRKCISANHLYTIHDFVMRINNNVDFQNAIMQVIRAFVASQLQLTVTY